jgi:hypothetical protein
LGEIEILDPVVDKIAGEPGQSENRAASAPPV